MENTFNGSDCASAYGFDTEDAYYKHLHELSIEAQEKVIELNDYRTAEQQVQTG
jgi:hypothetical protein